MAASGGDTLIRRRHVIYVEGYDPQGAVTLHTSTYPLDAINDAMADLDNGRLQGRGILVPA